MTAFDTRTGVRGCRRWTPALAALALACGAGTWAQVVSVPAAHLHHAEGSVAHAPQGDSEWHDVQPRRLLKRGDRLWTDRGSRAEVQAGGHALRIDGETQLVLENASETATQLSLTQGSLAATVTRANPGDSFEVGTPNLAFRARQPGDYRIDVDTKQGVTRVAVQSGLAVVYGEQGEVLEMRSGQRVTFKERGLARLQQPAFAATDDFDRWAGARRRGEPTVRMPAVAAGKEPAAPAPVDNRGTIIISGSAASLKAAAAAARQVPAAGPAAAGTVLPAQASQPVPAAKPIPTLPAATPLRVNIPAAPTQAMAPAAASAVQAEAQAQARARARAEADARARAEAEARARAEAAREKEERQRIAQQRAEEERRAARAEREKRAAAAAETKREQDRRRAVAAKRAEDERRQARAQREQELKKQALAKRAEDERRQAQARRAAEEKKQAAARAAEERRVATARAAEAQKVAENARRQQLARLQEQAQREEQAARARREQAARRAEEERHEEQLRREDQARREELARREEQARREEEFRRQRALADQWRRDQERREQEVWLRQRQYQPQPMRPAPMGVPARRVS